MVEFTGERVIPGQVEPDLWNEHLARYLFAATLASDKRVLDAGCGSGYGSRELARTARQVIGIDISAEAAGWAATHFPAPNLRFASASCSALPLADASVDLAVAFEVIEHVAQWREALAELRRVLAPSGMALISTPNKQYYADSRSRSGPNPYHVHEFDYEEFTAALAELFPAVTLYFQNHVGAISLQPAGDAPAPLRAAAGEAQAVPEEAHFFLAVCTLAPQAPPAPFLYVPSTANVLREREKHIERLESELAVKDEWLVQLRAEKQNLVEMFRVQKAELDKSNVWAGELETSLGAAQSRIVQLQEELAASTAGYEAQVAELNRANLEKTEWALRVQRELEATGAELVHCVELLDAAEKTVEERTAAWQAVTAQLGFVKASRWVRAGRRLGLGPELPDN